jgi:hypothetical protein
MRLKGGISYGKYLWTAETGACDLCKALDGTTYETADDLPGRPHPNCRCHIDLIKPEGRDYSDFKYDLDKMDGRCGLLTDELKVLIEKGKTPEQMVKAQALMREIEMLQEEIFDYTYPGIYDRFGYTYGIDPEDVEAAIQGFKRRYEGLYKRIDEEIDVYWKKVKETEEETEKEKVHVEKIRNDPMNEILYDAIKDLSLEEFSSLLNNAGTLTEQVDSVSLWEIATKPGYFDDSNLYIKRNGQIVNNITDLRNNSL